MSFSYTKTTAERAVAMAFPTLVEHDESNDENDDLSVLSDEFRVARKQQKKKKHLSFASPCDAEANRSNGSAYRSNCNEPASASDSTTPNNHHGGKSDEYYLDPTEVDPTDVPSTNSTPVTMTAHSEWWMPPPVADSGRNNNPSRKNQRKKQKPHCGDILCLAMMVCIVLGCMAAVATVIWFPKYKNAKPAEEVITPTASPTSWLLTEHYRLEAILEWLRIDYPLLSSSPQYASLEFLVYADLPHILGADIPSKARYDSYQQLLQPVAHERSTGNSSTSSNYVNEEHRQMALFEMHLTQRYALLVWNFATKMESPLGAWGTLTGTTLHECLWPGVTCRHDDLAVTELDLYPSTMGMDAAVPRGTIPTELGMLQHLEKLFLSENQLTGELPSEIYNLSNLYGIQLSNTLLDSTLSSDIGKLQQLEFLDLRNSGFHGPIPSELATLTKLKFLFLNQNNFGPGTVPSELGELMFLEKLTVHGTMLYGKMPRQICNLTATARLEVLTANCLPDEPFRDQAAMETAMVYPGFVLCECCTECF